jgi:hypothetical protein
MARGKEGRMGGRMMASDVGLRFRSDLPDVVMVAPGTSPFRVSAYLHSDGALPKGCRTMSLQEFLDLGRESDCDCGMLSCVCLDIRKHDRKCRYVVVRLAPTMFMCRHRLEICPDCDACTCGKTE